MKKNKIKNYIKNAALGFLCLFMYFFIPSLELYFLKVFNIDYDTMPLTLKVIYLITWEIITICLIMFTLNKKVIKDIKDMKKNHKSYFKKYLKFYLIALGIMIISNLLINSFVTKGIASNEETLRNMFKISPIYIFFSSVIYAPIVEELVFRQGLRNIIPQKALFIFISGIVFGGLHILSGNPTLVDLLYLIPYCAPGFAFAYILSDSDNICISTSLHFMHNGVLISLQFLLLIFS